MLDYIGLNRNYLGMLQEGLGRRYVGDGHGESNGQEYEA